MSLRSQFIPWWSIPPWELPVDTDRLLYIHHFRLFHLTFLILPSSLRSSDSLSSVFKDDSSIANDCTQGKSNVQHIKP